MFKAIAVSMLLGAVTVNPTTKTGAETTAPAPGLGDRRGDFLLKMQILTQSLEDNYKAKFVMKAVYFAVEGPKQGLDSAFVTWTMTTKDQKSKDIGMFFIFRDGKWNSFPEDFEAIKP